jgi:DNA-binding response OmpR family regulator
MRKRILVIEDTPDLLDNITDILHIEGYKVSTSSNGKEALDHLSKSRYDLIITDLLMPVMSGFELIAFVRKNSAWNKTKIIVYSAMPFIANQDKLFEQGANFYLKKPSSLNDLVKAVNKLVSK